MTLSFNGTLCLTVSVSKSRYLDMNHDCLNVVSCSLWICVMLWTKKWWCIPVMHIADMSRLSIISAWCHAYQMHQYYWCFTWICIYDCTWMYCCFIIVIYFKKELWYLLHMNISFNLSFSFCFSLSSMTVLYSYLIMAVIWTWNPPWLSREMNLKAFRRMEGKQQRKKNIVIIYLQ